MTRWVGMVVLLGVAACARRTEFIGRVLGDGSVPAEVSLPEPDGGFPAAGPSDAPASGWSCPAAEPSAPSLPAPAWNCGGLDRCLREPEVDPVVFAGAAPEADPLQVPALVYPLAGSIHPVNLPRITLQWRRGSPSHTAFRIRIQPVAAGEPPYDLFVPYRRPSGPTTIEELDATWEVRPDVWRYIAQQNAGRTVELTVAAHDATTGRVAASEPKAIRFSGAPVEGGLYYLGTEPPRQGIHRHVFGALTAQPVVAPLSAANAFNCGGCHSVSWRGTTLAFAATYAGNLTVASTTDLDNPTKRPRPPPMPDTADAIAPAVSPDGRFIVGRHGTTGSLVVYDAASGLPLSELKPAETQGRIDFPQWSPDGREIVATRARSPSQPAKPYSASDGHLVVLAFSHGRLSVPPEVVASEPDQVHAYPSWSPDGKWIVFVSSPVGGESFNNPVTRLRLVRRDGGGGILDLARAMPDGMGAGTTFPRFAPTGQQDCQLLFITFHSRMNYGVLRRNSTASEGGWQQLWMSALDLSRPGDPSTPPVWLPFQDINQKNVLPSWSAAVPCAGDRCDQDAVCQSGRCVPRFD
jgi:hypothetical protein